AGVGNPDACGATIDANSTDDVFPGTYDGAITLSTGGPGSSVGTCIDLVSAQFTLLADAGDLGPDGLPCTDDDFASPTPPFALPLTTDTATATLNHAVKAPGGCANTKSCYDAG